MCQSCWEKKSASPGSVEPWLPKGVPRLTRGNIFGFLFVFVYCFLLWRFDLPLHHYPVSAKASSLIALLFASIAVYVRGDR
jgi:hypothetical protein